MTKTDIALPPAKAALNDFLMAMSLLTRLPVPQAQWGAQARAAWAYPLVGLVVGLGAAIVASVALWLALGPAVAALLLVATTILLTGAMHEDGLADCADGFWGGCYIARRLEIMKDSMIGTYGTIALILSIALRWTLYATLLAEQFPLWALILPAMISRAGMVSVMQALPHARGDGLSQTVGRPGARATIAALLIGLLGVVALPGSSALLILASLGVALWLMSALARQKIGGQTGDVLGATQQVAEIALLLAVVAGL